MRRASSSPSVTEPVFAFRSRPDTAAATVILDCPQPPDQCGRNSWRATSAPAESRKLEGGRERARPGYDEALPRRVDWGHVGLISDEAYGTDAIGYETGDDSEWPTVISGRVVGGALPCRWLDVGPAGCATR
jgi:hypothetical protein